MLNSIQYQTPAGTIWGFVVSAITAATNEIPSVANKGVVAVIEGLYLRVKIAALTAALTLVFACSAAADPDPPITDEEIIAKLTSYLDIIEGPPILLWDDVGAPAFAPQTCANYVGLNTKENNPTVTQETNGTYLISLTDTRQPASAPAHRWRLDAKSGEFEALQVVC